MNKMTNDFNEEVIVIGQEGSIAWVKQKYPRALKRTNALFDAGQYDRMNVWGAMRDARNEMEYYKIPKEHIQSIFAISEFAKNGYF